MKSTIEILENRISKALEEITGQSDCPALVSPAKNPQFGDYQANGVMAAAKKTRTNPRQLAQQVVEKLQLDNICENPEIAGPGFINLRLKDEYISNALMKIKADPDRLAVDSDDKVRTVVVDFSAPNIAKQMHVGHLRSTIIGDCICRMLEFQGHKVIRQNHIGDWGTQFGMLIAYFHDKYLLPEIQKRPDSSGFVLKDDELQISDLEDFYKKAKALFDTDESFNLKAKEYVVKLHNKDQGVLSYWQQIVDESREHYQPIYKRLNVTLKTEDERGESFYADKLADVIKDLKSKGILKESDGAMCVFPEGFKNKLGDPLPFIVQKTDGAFLYATTDLAAIRFRTGELKADEIVYVTDFRQSQHFEMLFAAARMAGWVTDDIKLNHVTFGTMLGTDNKPFKTRSGETVKLKDLLDESIERAFKVVEEKNPDLPDSKKSEIAHAVGIGAVKYSDYSNNRNSDYIFSFDKMLAMEGNTAPYMQYAYARVKSIGRKALEKGMNSDAEISGVSIVNLADPSELDLSKQLLRYGEAIKTATEDYRPSYLTTYLYELAQKFSSFYSSCPVLDAAPAVRANRLLLCDLTARTIRHGLEELLGIKVIEQM